MKITFILLISIISAYSLENDKSEIRKITESLFEILAEDNKSKNFFDQYFTDNYIFLGGELENTNYNIIENFNIEKIKILGDSAYLKVRINRLAIITLKGFYKTDDFIFLEFILKKQKNENWKFDKQINNNGFWFLERELIRYISSAFNTYNSLIVTHEHYNYHDIMNRHKELLNYYHNHFSFSFEYLSKQSIEKLTILRNEIFAHYGRKFKTSWIQEYFDKQIWYSPSDKYSDSLLTENDIINIELIKQVEQQIKK